MKTDIKKGLHYLLKDILINGELTEKDDSKIKEYLGTHIYIKNPNKNNNLQEYKTKIKNGEYDLKNYGLKNKGLLEYASAIDNQEQLYLKGEKSFIYSYPNRIFHQKATKNNKETINQYNIMINRLKQNKGTNRAVATIYNPFQDYDEQDIPCLNWIQTTIRKNELNLHCMFRSNDIYGAWYGNMLFLTYYGLKIVNELNKTEKNKINFKGIDYHATSTHIYEINLQDAWKLYKETGE